MNKSSNEFASYMDKRMNRLESKFAFLPSGQQVTIVAKPDINEKDWDNATLMQEWNICPRTSVNYRQQGLEYFKRGGRVYYSPAQREQFVKKIGKGIAHE